MHKKARKGYSQLKNYLEELRDHQKSVIKAGDPVENSSLLVLTSLVPKTN